MNTELVNTFEQGWSTDIKENVKRKKNFDKGINGRIYAKNGVFSFNSVKGGKVVYTNDQIVKYLGGHEFEDELIVFAKVLKPEDTSGIEEEICNTILTANSFELTADVTADEDISVVDEITTNTSEDTNCYTQTTPAVDPSEFEIDFACDNAQETEIDFGEYYDEVINVANFGTCSINQNEVPINNETYLDAIYSLREDENFNLVGTLLWRGMQNWPLNGKITTEGVEENEFYKRVYYTDAVNYRRVVNVKDRSLFYREASEFNQILNNVLLQPEIIEVVQGGQLPAMKSSYYYRIISENGQVSEFSPSSFFTNIIFEDQPIGYRGGDISETTNKKVRIKCNIADPQPSSEVECVAVEYETIGTPTAIRNLGRKPVSNIVEFEHFGNEAEFTDNINIQDVVDFQNTWKYCNDFSSKKNKLLAAGLRNEPIPTQINNLEYLFPLHSWDINGNTHECIINPEPWTYRYIDPSNTDNLTYIRKKVYRSISSFGPLTITFKNTATNDSIELEIASLDIEEYTDITATVLAWLIDQKANNVDFDTFFPNLSIDDAAGQILLTPTDENIQTDMSLYVFESNNSQFIEDFDNDIVFLNVNVDTNNLVYGAQSIGFHQGVGIRLTYKEFKEPLLNQANGVYDGTGNLIDFIKPSGTQYFMKGEIYRLAFQAYDNDSTRYFSVPLGDVMIPSLGELKREIDDAGNAIITSQAYVNQSVENGVLYGHGIKMVFEVRLSCELQEQISMYQILQVPRTEENRTILCQGIAAPLLRVQHNGSADHPMEDAFRNKWILPYYGGPTYERRGLDNYDTYGENDQFTGTSGSRRTMQHRALMYFDSPDLYFDRVSDQFLSSSRVDVVAKLNTDHTPGVIRERGGDFNFEFEFGDDFPVNFGNEVYPKFSRKILEDQIEGENNSDPLPRSAREDRETGTFESHFINVSVFSNYQVHNESKNIDKAEELLRGEIKSGAAFGIQNDVSNNTFCLPNQPWFYGNYQRDWQLQGGRPTSSVFRSSVTSIGYKTAIIKTTEDLFTDAFIGPDIHTVDSQVRLGGSNHIVYDTIPLINLYKNNREFVYGGRTEQAYSQNTYVPLSRTIPTLKSSNATQKFTAEGDTYVTLNIRTKNDYGNDELFERSMNNHGDGLAKGDITAWERNGAWTYVVVLETQVEPKWTYQYEFYRVNGTHSFEATRPEAINQAYFNINDLKEYIPKPFKFRDDPNQGHIIAVSNVKLAGEYFDSWTAFEPNNFYPELEKNKGDISNLIKEKDKIFAIQRNQTSEIYIGTDRIVSDNEGKPINVQQGAGTVVDGHNVISSYGTAIRRAVNENFDFGFVFYDENENEFVKVNQPLFFKNLLHLDIVALFEEDPVIDSEAYFSPEFKESNIRVRTKNGNSYMFSYNEALKIFNGTREYNQDLYLQFRKKIFSPITVLSQEPEEPILSSQLEVLDKGNPLEFQGTAKTLVLGFYLNFDIKKVIQYIKWNLISNVSYPITQLILKSSSGQSRVITAAHPAYKNREGNQSLPGINESNDSEDFEHIKGNWIYVEMQFTSQENKDVQLIAVNNSIRISHQ